MHISDDLNCDFMLHYGFGRGVLTLCVLCIVDSWFGWELDWDGSFES